MEIDVESAAPAQHITPGFRKALGILVALTALCAGALAYIETDIGAKREHEQVKASRGAIEIFSRLAASSQRREFTVGVERRALETSLKANARVAGTPTESVAWAAARAQSGAEGRAARRLGTVARSMLALPEDGPVDPATHEAVTTEIVDLVGILEEQDHAVDEAHHYAVIQGRTTWGLSLVAIAASLLALAGLLGAGRAARVVMVTAAGALVLAVGITGSGFLA